MSNVSLMEKYRADLAHGRIQPDAAQAEAVTALDRLTTQMVNAPQPDNGLMGRIKRRFNRRSAEPMQGLYLWGGVGRGKTYLMDCFYECLPFPEKKRMHFHRFMHAVHAELNRLNRKPDPLDIVAQTFAADARIICFDEFFVSDITDAMILAGLMRELFALGVIMVSTSNVVPDDLYKNGLQRGNFLPAIDMIKRHMTVLNVDGGTDYRLRALERAEIYHSPLDDEAENNLFIAFRDLSPDAGQEGVAIEVEGRMIETRWVGDGVIWFDFSQICDGPRSQNDYIEISRCYNTVLISLVPQMDLYRDDVARRFISLVDEFYDRNVKLMISAETPLNDLYAGGNFNFEFERTVSRLQEMQTRDYLASEHRP